MTEPQPERAPPGPDFRSLFRASVLVVLGSLVLALTAWLLYRWIFER